MLAHRPAAVFRDAAFEGQSTTAAQRKLLDDAARFGLAHGYTVPLRSSWLPGAPRACSSVVPDGPVDRRSYSMVQGIAACLYTTMSCVRPLEQAESSVGLSRRERQCLALAAQGKDDWAIGKLLHLSHETVHWYLKRLRYFSVATQELFPDLEASPAGAGLSSRAPTPRTGNGAPGPLHLAP